MKPNETQIKMMLEIEQGEVELPRSHGEFFEAVKKIVEAYDFEKFERPLIERCRDQFISISVNSLDAGNWVYISEVKNILKKRNYFNELCKSMRNRGIKDPVMIVVIEMIKDGLLMVNGKKVSATLKAEKLHEKDECELSGLMAEARVNGNLEN